MVTSKKSKTTSKNHKNIRNVKDSKKSAEPKTTSPGTSCILCFNYFCLVLVNIWVISETAFSDISSAAMGFYPIYLFHKLGIILIMMFVASIVSIVTSHDKVHHSLAIYALILNLLLMSILPEIYYLFQKFSIILALLLLVPPIIYTVKALANYRRSA